MRHRILVVDDDATIGSVMRRALFGYEVTSVTSARLGLERIERGEQFDGVVCDVHMPDMDGIEFAAHVVRMVPSLAENILFLTGDHLVVRDVRVHHPVATKPIETHAIRSRLDQILKPLPRRASPVTPASERPTMPPPADDSITK